MSKKDVSKLLDVIFGVGALTCIYLVLFHIYRSFEYDVMSSAHEYHTRKGLQSFIMLAGWGITRGFIQVVFKR